MSDPESARPPTARPGGRTRGTSRGKAGAVPGAVGTALFREPALGGVDWHGSLGLMTAHCTIVIIDVEGFGRHSRTNPNKVRIRRGMYRAIERAFAASDIPWAACRHEDRGDGVLVLAPASISKALFVDSLLGALAAEIIVHNAAHSAPERMRLRLALHAGEISYDEYGVIGSSILHAEELLDTAELKRALARTDATLAVVASDWVFEEVVRHSERSTAGSYQPVGAAGGKAWIRLITPSRRRRAG